MLVLPLRPMKAPVDGAKLSNVKVRQSKSDFIIGLNCLNNLDVLYYNSDSHIRHRRSLY